jgi:hypothetical protein
MSVHFSDEIDWQRPWLNPFRATGERLVQAQDWRVELNALAEEKTLRNHRGLPIRFVPQTSLPPGMAYEAFISATGEVPTRENLHDFFNALVWLTFPKIKVQLNALQAREIETVKRVENVPFAVRGKIRDAATIFDENAALLLVRDAEWLDALRAHRWKEAFLGRRDRFWCDCQVVLFGHALMEKLVAPYKAITAHAWPVIANETFFGMTVQEQYAWQDTMIAMQVAQGLETSHFTPLPVLGVPDWYEGQNNAFYADTAVFRPKRSAK